MHFFTGRSRISPGVKPLVAQVKGHLFPYSRYFTLSTESISDEQSQGWQSHIFFNRKQQSAQIYRRTLQLYYHKDRDA